jgi:DNA-directed RNA polymerase specialized sigma24 family protein
MIESQLVDLTLQQNDKSGEENEFSESPDQKCSETLFLTTLSIVHKIVGRRNLLSLQSDASDVVQTIALRLWKWREKYSEKSAEMSPDEWKSFTARTAYNEINRHFSTKTLSQVSLETATNVIGQESAEGQTDTEVFSLIKLVWQEICRLTVRQRRALLLHSQELIIYLLLAGISDEDLARVLSFTMDEWTEIKTRLPLSDEQIADASATKEKQENNGLKTKSFKKARHEARLKLRRLT